MLSFITVEVAGRILEKKGFSSGFWGLLWAGRLLQFAWLLQGSDPVNSYNCFLASLLKG